MTMTYIELDRVGLSYGRGKGKYGYSESLLVFDEEEYTTNGLDITEVITKLGQDPNRTLILTKNQWVFWDRYGAESVVVGWAKADIKMASETGTDTADYIKGYQYVPTGEIAEFDEGDVLSGMVGIIMLDTTSRSITVMSEKNVIVTATS